MLFAGLFYFIKFLLAFASFFGGQLHILNTMSYATLYQPFQVHQVVHERALCFLGVLSTFRDLLLFPRLTKAHLRVYVFLQTIVQWILINVREKGRASFKEMLETHKSLDGFL